MTLKLVPELRINRTIVLHTCCNQIKKKLVTLKHGVKATNQSFIEDRLCEDTNVE